MIPSSEFKPKSGYVYVVTNECLKLVNAKGIFRGRKVKAVKIGNAKDFTNRLGSLNTAVYENFDFHLGIKTDDVVGLEGLIHTALQDYRIYTRDGNKTEFFACPLEEVIFRIKKLISRGHKENVEEYKGGKVIGRHGAGIRANIERQQLRRKKAMTLATDKAKCARDDVHKKGRALPFSFASVGISVGSDLVFMPTGSVVKVVDGKNKISFDGNQYSLSGFCKQFMPNRSPSGAYQGPKFFYFKGKALVDIRKDVGRSGSEPNNDIEQGEHWKGKTQLARLIARRGGNEGAYGGILHLFSRKRPCGANSKWRVPLEHAGIKFDTKDYVVDWSVANNPL
jgi:hypothetical protein